MNNIDFTQRNVAIDILRALTMLLMIFVNDLWTIKDAPEWLGHAQMGQDMLGLADIVFPCFLFVVGMSIPYAIERRFSRGFPEISTLAHILTRTLALLLMGVFIVNSEAGISEYTGLNVATYRILMVIAFFFIWNIYPKTDKPIRHLYSILKIAGLFILLYLAITFRDDNGGVFASRWWGILGLIGWTYLICAIIYLFARNRLKYLIPIWMLFILICILRATAISGEPILKIPSGNFLDQILDLLHIGNGALPALTMGGILLSLLSAKYIKLKGTKKAILVILVAGFLFFAGFISHRFWIVSKILETPTWIFYCSAIAVTTYAILYWLTEKGKASWFDIIKPAGTATLTCYLIPYILYSIIHLIHLQLPEQVLESPIGILKCIIFAFITVGITALLNKLGVKLKV